MPERLHCPARTLLFTGEPVTAESQIQDLQPAKGSVLRRVHCVRFFAYGQLCASPGADSDGAFVQYKSSGQLCYRADAAVMTQKEQSTA